MSADGREDSEPVAHVRDELEAVGTAISSLADERPLWSTALNAQFQSSLEHIRLAVTPPGVQSSIGRLLANSFASMPAIDTSRLLSATQAAYGTAGLWDALRFPTTPAFTAYSTASTFAMPDPPKSYYSPEMTWPGAYFWNDEIVIESFDDLNKSIAGLIAKVPDLRLVWRGHRNAEWGVHSSLYRRLMEQNGVKPPDQKPKAKQPYPDEDQLVAAEAVILKTARTDWRFDGSSALETFARIQHAGGPTRFLDVTKNPFIAAWFAVEQHENDDSADGRLLAFATTPVLRATDPQRPGAEIDLDSEWGDRVPPWHRWTDATARQSVDWGTGARRRLWIPPAYDPRISAQNAAFLLDGVPITTSKTTSYFKSNEPGDPVTYWTRADLLAAGSIFIKTFKPTRRPQANKHFLAPTFTFRIGESAKVEIREFLVSRFGYTRSYIYPDVSALAQYVRRMELPALGA